MSLRLASRVAVAVVVASMAGPALAQPADPDALLSRAVVLHQTGDLEGAAALYVQVLRLVPGAFRVRSNLGAAYAGLGRFDEAIEEYRRALDSEDDPAIRQNLGLALVKAGRLEEAATETERVLAARPGNRDVSVLLASIYLGLGENAKIVPLLTPLAETLPEDKGVAYALGTALLALNRTTEAQAVMDRVFRGNGAADSAEGHVLLGSLQAKRHDWPAALAEYEKARAANPNLPLVNYLVGEALMRGREDWAGAATAFRAELEHNPYHYESNLRLGTLLLEGGHLEEALPRLELAARLRGDDLSAKYFLGAAYLAADRLSEARPLLEAVSAAMPDRQPTQMKLAVLYTKLGLKEDAARARANAVRLQKEADARAFEGGKQLVNRAFGDSPGEASSAPDGPQPPEKAEAPLSRSATNASTGATLSLCPTRDLSS